jgi:hypothetical protein
MVEVDGWKADTPMPAICLAAGTSGELSKLLKGAPAIFPESLSENSEHHSQFSDRL